jgi:Tol biopolymer transport system component
MGGALVRHAIWIDANGRVAGEALPDAAYTSIRVSPDGRRAAMTVADGRTRVSDLFIADLQRRSLSRFSFDGQDHSGAAWSRDGGSLTFAVDRDAPPHLFSQPLNGDVAIALTKPGTVQVPNDWSSDGRIFFASAEQKTGHDILVRMPNGKVQPWLQTPNEEIEARLSPDQKWIAYTANSSGRYEVYVAATDRSAEPARVSVDGGSEACWSHDGRSVWFLTVHEIYSATITPRGNAIDVGAPVRVYSTSDIVRGFDAAPDGRLLVLTEASDVKPMNVIVGWKRDVERSQAKSTSTAKPE